MREKYYSLAEKVQLISQANRTKVTYAYDSYELPYYVENMKANMYLLVCG